MFTYFNVFVISIQKKFNILTKKHHIYTAFKYHSFRTDIFVLFCFEPETLIAHNKLEVSCSHRKKKKLDEDK